MPQKGSFTTTTSAKILRKRSEEIERPQCASVLLAVAVTAASKFAEAAAGTKESNSVPIFAAWPQTAN